MSFLERLSSLVDWFDFLPLSNRNHIVDGNFDFWNVSSATLTTNGSAPCTMYYDVLGTGGAGTVSAQSFNGNEPVGMTSPVSTYKKYSLTTASTVAGFMCQRIESVHTLAGKSATFSCWLWCDSGSITISQILAIQHFGSGGSPSSDVNTSSNVNWTITTTPQRFSVRLDIPNINGKTLGTNGGDFLQLNLYLPTGVIFALNTAQWQLERCSPQAPAAGRPTAFEYRGYESELGRVLRFYESDNLPVTYLNCSSSVYLNAYMSDIPYKVVKRATPTVTFSNVLYYSAGNPTTMPTGNISLVNTGVGRCTIYLNGGMTSCFGIAGGTYTADARL